MATATMGPPLSPREPRRSGRSGRRQTTSGTGSSGSTSKSPEFAVPPEPQMRPRENAHRPSLPSTNSSARVRRPKQDEIDDPTPAEDHPKLAVLNGSAVQNGRSTKRKAKTSPPLDAIVTTESTTNDDDQNVQPEKEDSGDTRCICGRDDESAGQFWICCDTCGVWQHGPCMGVFDEAEAKHPDFQYFCERCQPDRHPELLERKKSKRPRQSSAPAHAPPRSASHSSRSRSPTQPVLQKPTKRRNTMNSRDAAFDDQLQEIIEATAAEAAAHASHEPEPEVHINGRAKRKRTAEDDTRSAKRTRSGSVASDMPPPSVIREPTPMNVVVTKPPLPPPPPPPAPKAAPKNNKRGGARKAALVQEAVGADSEEAVSPASRKSSGGRAKPTVTPAKRSGASSAHQPADGSRRSTTNGLPTPTSAAASRAYHQTHAYIISQQQLLTSWNLPDYLAHLEPMLPTNTPRPLEVRSGVATGVRESVERTVERGVKVRWPSKRTSVGDMSKRVRAILEWVGREQATHSERQRRTNALRRVLTSTISASAEPAAAAAAAAMLLGSDVTASPEQEKEMLASLARSSRSSTTDPSSSAASILDPTKSTTTLMEELMEELIDFQQRYSRSRS